MTTWRSHVECNWSKVSEKPGRCNTSSVAWVVCGQNCRINCNQSLQPKRSQRRRYVGKSCKDLHWLGKLWFPIIRYFQQSAFVNNHLPCYWPSIHNLIEKIWQRISVLYSHNSKVGGLLDEHWEKDVAVLREIFFCIALKSRGWMWITHLGLEDLSY